MWPLPERSLPPLSPEVQRAFQAAQADVFAADRPVETIHLFAALAEQSPEFRAVVDEALGTAAYAPALLGRLVRDVPPGASGGELRDDAKRVIFRCSSIAADAGEDRAGWRSMMGALLTDRALVRKLQAASAAPRPLDVALWDVAGVPPALSADASSFVRRFSEIANRRTRGACGEFALVRQFESRFITVDFFPSAFEAEAARVGATVRGTRLTVHDDRADPLHVQVVMHVAVS
ncbi:MAG: hypothetical protein QOJ39_68 [Candidatus Eremiobacteraeota bacterium]|jgi:hypothetical protein|nr:hypothetical protein [Candidatus Eremiobacteraeota bacterium]